VKLKDVDQKLEKYNERLDAVQKITDARLESSQAVFDQINMRANEVIQSAERARSRITMAASTIGGVAAIIVTVLGFFGIDKAYDISQAITELKPIRDEAVKITQEIADFREDVGQLKETRKDFHLSFMITKLEKEVSEENKERAKDTSNTIFTLEDEDITDAWFHKVQSYALIRKMEAEPKIFRDYLENSIDANYLHNDRQRFITYYLLLSALIYIEDEKKYQEVFSEFKKFVRGYNNKDAEDEEMLREDLFQYKETSEADLVDIEKYLDDNISEDDRMAAVNAASNKMKKLDEIWKQIP
jgi:hypothetical protein